MRLEFLDRTREVDQLTKALAARDPGFIVVFGRRRCGKSTLLQQVIRPGDIYYAADQREAPLQRRTLAGEVARRILGFAEVEYPSWLALLQTLDARAERGTCLVLDEFPYLVQISPELPSLVQKFLDDPARRIHLAICGSSQGMMQGLILNAAAPLYGRASQVLAIRPLAPFWIQQALEVHGTEAIEQYAVWGGVPRYWELARDCTGLQAAVEELVLDKYGVLHSEPERLLLDDMRSAVQANSLLSLIANGCHRLTEIGARLGKPAGHLARPLAQLIELGYIRREVPFGETTKSTKRSLYKLNDPFLIFWYRYVQPNRSLLERDLIDDVSRAIRPTFAQHVADIWEDLARLSTAALPVGNIRWKPAQRWWGRGLDGQPMEIALVAEALNGEALLLGKVKWRERPNQGAVFDRLRYCAANFPQARGRETILGAWLKQGTAKTQPREFVVHPAGTLAVLR